MAERVKMGAERVGIIRERYGTYALDDGTVLSLDGELTEIVVRQRMEFRWPLLRKEPHWKTIGYSLPNEYLEEAEQEQADEQPAAAEQRQPSDTAQPVGKWMVLGGVGLGAVIGLAVVLLAGCGEPRPSSRAALCTDVNVLLVHPEGCEVGSTVPAQPRPSPLPDPD